MEAHAPQARPSQVAVSMRDQFVLTLAPRLLQRLAQGNPGSTLNIVAYERERVLDELARGAVDIAVAVDPPDAPGLIATTLYRETFVCLTPHRRPPTLAQYLNSRHVATTAHMGYSGIDAALARHGYQRRIAAYVPYFAALVHVAESEGLYATLPRRVVEAMTPRHAFVHALPIAIPGFRVSMVWHRRCEHDEGSRWLRGLLAAAAASPRSAVTR